jgi:hypothetical protein
LSNTSGHYNTATGHNALFNNTTGINNTANGVDALFGNNGNNNTATGFGALQSNGFGVQNTANGAQALSNNAGINNTATGFRALFFNTTGGQNTANGEFALHNNITGDGNTGVGRNALAISTSGDFNTALGANAGNGVTTASNVICIGAAGADVSDTTWIGNVYGTTTQSGTTLPVIVSNNGQLGTLASSERFKKDVSTMEKVSEVILALRPVTFHYKSDAQGTPQFGLIAEDVAKVDPDLVVRDRSGEIYSVRYEAVNAMLLNEFLKEHREVQELKKEVAALTAGLQKVSTELELSKTSPRTVVDSQ